MVKRFLSLGAAIALIFALSVPVFASDHTSVNQGFPLFYSVKVRQGGSEVYTSSNSLRIQDFSDFTNNNTGNIIIDLYSKEGKTVTIEESTFSYEVPVYDFYMSYYNWLNHDNDGDYSFQTYTLGSQGTALTNHTEEYDVIIDSENWSYSDSIDAGYYVLEGVLRFDNNAIGSLDNFCNMFTGISAVAVADPESLYSNVPIRIANPVFDYFRRDGQDIITYKFVLDVPSSVGHYDRVNIQIGCDPQNLFPSLKGYSIGSALAEFDTAKDIFSLSLLLNNLFGKVQNTLNVIAGYILDNQASENKDQQSLDTAQSEISGIETFEQNMFETLNGKDNPNGTHTPGLVDQLPLQVPDYSDSSMGNALMAVSYIMTSTISDLGGYQVSVTVPMVLGIMLILIGRGTLALGRAVSASARARRREGGGGK